MEDKRLTKRLTDYWKRLRKDLPLPVWERFNSGALEDVWPQCCVWRVEAVDSEKRVNQYTYEYVGSDAQKALGKDLTGLMFLSHLQHFPAARITKKIDDVVKKAAPVLDSGNFVNENNKIVKYRSCLLPFGTKDGRVTRLVLGLSWRAF